MRKFQAKKNDNELVIEMYDYIGASFFDAGVTAKGVAKALRDNKDAKNITVRINSPGGDVFEGLAIYNQLAQDGRPVRVVVDGLAASIASIIAMAGDEIVIARNAMMMIHDPWTIAIGNAADMDKTAEDLRKITGGLVDTYAARSKQDKAAIVAMMAAETLMNADEAVDNGFADEIVELQESERDAATYAADLSRFQFRRSHDRIAALFTGAQDMAEQTKVEAPAPVAPVTTVATQNSAPDPRTELKRFMDSFGADGAKWYADGVTYDQAQAKHAEAVKAELAALKAQNAELAAKATAAVNASGQAEPVTAASGAPEKKDRGPKLAKFIRIAGAKPDAK